MPSEPEDTLPVSKMRQIAKICDEFETALKAGETVTPEDYLDRVGEAERSTLKQELETVELQFHRQRASKAVPESVEKDPGVKKFVRTLVASQLMSQEEIDEFQSSLSEDEKPKTAEDLAKALYRNRKLTRFQTQAVFQGKTKGMVVGNYVVLDKIGQGGMGHVYKAQHKRMKREVALKVLPSNISRQKGIVERFHREVVAAARLNHTNIVTAYDADEADGVHFLVMELVEGVDLTKLVRSKGTLSVAKAIDYVTQAATGLQYAHENGLIHRDIKPSNLLLDKSGIVKILDMGLARFEREMHESTAAESLTQSGQVMGTLDYMAPEQATDTHRADAKADIYSLGCTLYFLLTGQVVFEGQTMATKIIAHREEPVPSLRAQREDVPEALDRVFQKMLAKRPEARQESMAEVVGGLESCGGQGQETAETAAFQVGAGNDNATIDQEAPLGDVTIGPAPASDSDSDSSGAGNWLKAELPESPTVFRPAPPRAVKNRKLPLPIVGSIGAGVLVVGLLLVVFVTQRPKATPVADTGVSDASVELPPAEEQSETMLVVVVTVPGAEIFVDGCKIEVAITGDAEPIEIPVSEGAHDLRIVKDGEELLVRSVSVAAGAREVVGCYFSPTSRRHRPIER